MVNNRLCTDAAGNELVRAVSQVTLEAGDGRKARLAYSQKPGLVLRHAVWSGVPSG